MNLLVIISDQHSREVLGCYGNNHIHTPNLDKLAKNGTIFKNSYCNYPICVPSRASMVIGDYASTHGYWDNAHPYAGEKKGFGHRLTEKGYQVTTVGKLHFKDNIPETGFPDQRLPMNVHEKTGDIQGCIRDERIRRKVRVHTVTSAGSGETDYIRYDRKVAQAAADFLKNETPREGKPWMLYVGFVTPHFPLTAPEKFFNLYHNNPDIPFPYQYGMKERPMHPVIEYHRRCNCLDMEFDADVVRKAVAGYYALVSFMDEQVGKVLDALNDAGLAENTRIIYTSDHGDNVGNHGLFFKHTLYEGSVGVPMIVAGPDIPAGQLIENPVSLVDIYPSVLDCVGADFSDEDRTLPGESLWPLARGEKSPWRTIFAEYHAVGINAASYMVRKGDYKLNYYVGYPSQLFDLKNDPKELVDLTDDPDYQGIKKDLEAELRRIVDPEETDRKARAAQKAMVEKHGGEEMFVGKPKQFEYSPVPEEHK